MSTEKFGKKKKKKKKKNCQLFVEKDIFLLEIFVKQSLLTDRPAEADFKNGFARNISIREFLQLSNR